MWNKAYFLASIIAGCSLVVGLIVGILEFIFNVRLGSAATLTSIYLSAYAIGGTYTQKQMVVMPQSLKLQTSIYMLLISIGTAIINLQVIKVPLGIIPIVGIILIFNFILTYLFLGYGSKEAIKRVRK